MVHIMLDDSILIAVRTESARAHAKHSANGMSILDPEMPLIGKLVALMEEHGEVGRALTKDGYQGVEHVVKELIQLANVALCIAQCIDAYGLEGQLT
jgi:hypothetical protein